MAYIKDNLTKGEKIVSTPKFHWINWLPIGVIVLLSIPMLGIPLLLAIPLIIRLLTTEMAVTDKRVIVKSGWISRKIDELRFSKIETVEFNQGILSRILGYGQVKVTGTGLSRVYFNAVVDPKSIKNIIDESLED